MVDDETRAKIAAMMDQVMNGQLPTAVDPLSRRLAALLRYPFVPGDPVVDSVTGEVAKVIYVSRRALRRPAPQSSTR